MIDETINDEYLDSTEIPISIEEENDALMAAIPEDDDHLFISDWMLGLNTEQSKEGQLSKRDRLIMHTRDPYEFFG